MKRLAIWMAVVVAGATLVRAGEPAPATDLAGELLGLMKVDENMKEAFAMTKQMMSQQAAQMEKMSGQPSTGKAADIQARVMDLMASELNWEKLKDPYIELYASTFTAEELQGLVDFYKTPAGQAFIRKQPDIMKKTMALNQKLQMSLMPRVQALLQELKVTAPPVSKPVPATP